MSVDDRQPIRVERTGDQAITISGDGVGHALLRLVLSAKFNLSPNTDVLLSPYVRDLIDVLLPMVKQGPTIDWSSPASQTPPEFLAVVELLKSDQSLAATGEPLEMLVRRALYPHDVPLGRLGLGD